MNSEQTFAAPGSTNVDLRVLGPESVAWQHGDDWRFMLMAGRSLLLQVAHPVVAAGVAQHSNFAANPWKRLIGTLEMFIGGIIWGGPDAVNNAARLRKIHERINGIDAAGRPYSALQPDAFHWVHATLVDGMKVMTDNFERPLTPNELDRFYGEMCDVGRLYGVRDADMPPNWLAFQGYFDEMVRTALEDNSVVREVMKTIAKAPPPPGFYIPRPLWRLGVWPASHVMMLTTIGLLPAELRARWGLPWTRRQELELRAVSRLVRRAMPLIPERIRLHPWAYAALHKSGTALAA